MILDAATTLGSGAVQPGLALFQTLKSPRQPDPILAPPVRVSPTSGWRIAPRFQNWNFHDAIIAVGNQVNSFQAKESKLLSLHLKKANSYQL
jgi:hypothetical protein